MGEASKHGDKGSVLRWKASLLQQRWQHRHTQARMRCGEEPRDAVLPRLLTSEVVCGNDRAEVARLRTAVMTAAI